VAEPRDSSVGVRLRKRRLGQRGVLFDAAADLVDAAPGALEVDLHLEVFVEVQHGDALVVFADHELLFVEEEVFEVDERAEEVLAESGGIVEQPLDFLDGEVVEFEAVLDCFHGVLLVDDEVAPASVGDAQEEEVPGVDDVFEEAWPLGADGPVFFLVLQRGEHPAGTEVVCLVSGGYVRLDVVDGLEELGVPRRDELLLGVRVFADCVDRREVVQRLCEEAGLEVRVVSLEDEVGGVRAEELQGQSAEERVHRGVVRGAEEGSEFPAGEDAVLHLEGEGRGGEVCHGVELFHVDDVFGAHVLLHQRLRDGRVEVALEAGLRRLVLELSAGQLAHEVLQHEVHFFPDEGVLDRVDASAELLDEGSVVARAELDVEVSQVERTGPLLAFFEVADALHARDSLSCVQVVVEGFLCFWLERSHEPLVDVGLLGLVTRSLRRRRCRC